MAERGLITTELYNNEYLETSSKGVPLQPVFIKVTSIERWTLSPYLVVTAAAALFLNGSIFVTILRHEVLRQKALFLILGWQAFCDFATPFIYVPLGLQCLWSEDVYLPERFGALVAGLRFGVGTYMSVYILTLLVAERYVFICQPLHYNTRFSMKKTTAYLFGIVVLVTVSVSVYIMEADVRGQAWELTYHLTFRQKYLIGFAIPLIFIASLVTQTYCFRSITQTVLNQRRRIIVTNAMSRHGAEAPLSTTPRIFRAVIGVARLCGAYWITWFPTVFVIIVDRLKYRGETPGPGFQHVVRLTIMFAMTVPPLCNPLICLRFSVCTFISALLGF